MTNLFEREGEVSALEQSVLRAARGDGGMVAIRGPAGIGKTRLLETVVDMAAEHGATTLAASGSPLEQGLPYATIRQAFAGVVKDRDSHEALLGGRAAGASSLLGVGAGSADAGGGERTVGVLDGLFWATVNLAERGPLVVAIDDGHWVDPPSLRFLSYLSRRIDGLPALLVYAHRPEAPGLGTGAHEALLASADHLDLAPAPLSTEATTELIESVLGVEPDAGFCHECHRATAGNPLLIRELLRAVTTRGIEPNAEAAARIKNIGPAAVARTIRSRLAQLPEEAGKLAAAASVAGEGAPLDRAAEIAGLERGEAAIAAAELHRAEVLAPVAQVSFVHSLVREAISESIEPLAAGLAHERATELLRAQNAPPEEAARHLVHVPPGAGDEWRVATLRAAAARALEAGDAETATAYLRRALEEPPGDNVRVEVLTELASAELPLSFDATVEHLREALPLIEAPQARAQIKAQIAHLMQTADPEASVAGVSDAIAELGEADIDLRRELLATLVQASMLTTSPIELPPEIEASLRSEAAGDGDGARLLAATLTYRDTWEGVPAAEIEPERARAFSGDWVRLVEKGGGPHTMAFLALVAADDACAERVVEEWIRFGRRSGRRAALGGAKMFSAHLHLARGELEDAALEAEESLEIFGTWGMRGITLAHAAAAAAGAALERGDHEGAALALERAGVSDEEAGSVGIHGFLWVRARLRAAMGETRVALTETLELGRRFEALGGRNPGLLPWRPFAARLMADLGEDLDEARGLAAEALVRARRWGTPRAIGRALTAVGCLEDGDAAIATHGEAVSELEGAPAPMELIDALLALGAALTSAGREADARPHLRRAMDIAAERGAAGHEERARRALIAAGGRPRRAAARGPHALTARERRIALLAAVGRTNREIAEELYLVPRTIEGHLSSVYRKLGIESRGELAAVLRAAD